MVPPLITLEEHFFSTAVFNDLDESYSEQFKYLPNVANELRDLGSLRLSEMEKGQVSLQVISHGPGCPSTSQCRSANDQLATAVKANPTRFAGFAVLPMADPEAAAAELERVVRTYGFVGALVDNHVAGTYYDGKDYRGFWAKVQELDVPVYLHPTWPADRMGGSYAGGGSFSAGAEKSLGASGWGWHSETGLHVLRLYASGLFDELPRLKVVIGHFGEMLPFQLERIFKLSIRWGKQQRKFKQVWDENIWITTSGVWSLAPMACIMMNTKVERVLYSVDFPFERNENGLKWFKELEGSGLCTPEQLEMIAYKNAEALLGVKAPAR
ncbi:hypothetical protein K431DRAFT_286319 [Polychaeton citri CBS 116435]|uniref:Amidohydrolase-related domain-containing protein n=1 Tax=Polychaeton citri CBS 116435 TaxID=1314669 RepID=A0A9P4UNI2_9PEZI|nr:hypothetical protein K431DRAFT_286319 [Polychaeton citri CBS 116435]